MADKDKDEEKFEDDEDFGLPELHYEELDDDSDSSSDEEEEKPAETPKPEEPTPDPFGEKSTSTESEETFYEEESFDEFKDDSASSSVFDSDETSSPESFGDITTESQFGVADTYKESQSKESYAAYYDDDSSKRAKSNFTKIVIIGTLLFASIAIVFVVFMDGDDLMGFGDKKEVTPPPVEPAQDETAVDTTAFQPVEPEPVVSQPTQLTPGEITTLEQRTGKSYVVIGSFFDGDLAMDYAKALAKNGHSPQIIPPFRDYRFYRVAVAEFNSFAEAEAQAPSYGEQFGREAWPLRY
mgnify:CR=1 FL=1|tara:strand:+ start:5602 stop:6492 length:891 start_codon:yes stop_codon:yes gene_type:complete